MSFFSSLIDSFVPAIAHADNEESNQSPHVLGVIEKSSHNDSDDVPSKATTEDLDKSSSDKPAEESEKPAEEPEKPAEESSEASTDESTEESSEPSTEESSEASSEESSEEAAEESAEESSEGGNDAEEEEGEGEEDEDEDEDEDDEDEEEEGGDPLDKLREECAHHEHIKPYVHHYSECVERVTKEQEEPDYEDKDYKEDCVEEFFHLQHHLNDCVAPRLFHKLK